MSFRIDQLAVLNLATVGNSITAGSFVKSGGTSSQFLKADGSVDTNAYITGITSGMVTTALGYTPVPTTRTLTINGTSYDLSADRSWSISAGVSSVTGSGSGISVSPTTGAVVVSNTGVTSNVAGTGISVSGATGAVTITNTGVTSIVAGTAITISGATGAVTINNAGVTSVNGSTGAITGIATTAQLANYLPLSGGTLTGQLSVSTSSIGMDWWKDGSGTYMEFYGTSTATRKLRLQGSNGSGAYAQWFIDGGNGEIYGASNGTTNFLMNSSTVYLRYAGSDKFWTGSDGTRNAGWLYMQNTGAGIHYPSYNSHFYMSGGAYWHINPTGGSSYGGLILYSDYNGTTGGSSYRKGYLYYDTNGFGFLGGGDGDWGININPSTSKYVTVGGHSSSQAYSAVTGVRLMFGGGDSDAQGNYYIGTNLENYGGNYNKLDLRWHTGIRMGAQPVYGGIRMYDTEDLGTVIFSVGTGDANVRVTNNLYMGGNLVATQSWVTSQGYVTGGPFIQNILGDSGAFNLNVSGQQAFARFSTGAWVNGPTSGNYSHVLSINGATDNRTVQIYLGDVPGYLWWRPNQNGTWHPWERILTSNNYNSWVPSLTGGGASGTWSITATGNLPYGNWGGDTGMNDNRLYLRTSGDTNHYLWNASDDWEELGAYAGTGFRVTSNNGANGLLYVYGSSNGGYTYSPYSFRAPIFYDSDDTNYYADFHSTSNSGIRLRGGMLMGPNPTWGAYLQVGGDGNTNSSAASVVATNGNLHLDSANGYATYINHYYGNRIYFGSGGASGGTYNHSSFSPSGYLYIGGNGSDASYRLQVNGTGYATSDFRSPIFYDSDNTSYYGDFASTSRLNVLEANSIYTYGGLSTNGGNSLLGVQSPGGASRANSGSTETGAFKITFPASVPVYGMFKLVIHIYEYGQRGNGYEIHCGGHMYPNYMYNRFQVQYGSSNSPLNVRYGNDGTYGCIWIGDTNTTWSYPQIWVSEFMMGYSNTSWTTWRSGWNISLVTSYGNSGAMDGPYACDYGYAASAGSASTSSQVTINYNNDSNSTYQMLWGSGNSVYGTAGVYVNPYDDRVYANYFSAAYYMDVYTSAGSGYLRLTDNQVYRPGGGGLHLNWSSNGDVYATGPGGGRLGVGNNGPAYKLHVSGDIYADGGWLRVSGSSGLYFESYGGGWHMTDSTWIRSYNSKNVYMSADVRTGGQYQLESGYSYWNRFGTYSGALHRIAYMSFDWNSNYDSEYNHSIASTDINAGYSDCISINSYNDVTIRLDSNANNNNSYLRISDNTTGDGTFAWIGRESGVASMYLQRSSASGVTSAPAGTAFLIDSGGNNYITFRNTADNGTYSGLAFVDNNIGGFVVFGNYGAGVSDYMAIAGYNGGVLQYGTANSVDPTARTTIATWNSSGLTINSGNMYAPIYYDSNNTGYYCDPASTSVLNTISSYTIYNTSLGSGYYFTAGSWGWRHQTPSGYIEFGPANVSYAHIYTDRGNFYFNVDYMYQNGNRMLAENIWINSKYFSSGGEIYSTRYYDANDSNYYVDPHSESNLWRFTAASMTRNAINYLSINSPYSTRAGQGSQYLNGTMGWGTTDFNTIYSNWGSGFIDTWSSPGNAPNGSTSHWVGLQAFHYNHQNGTNAYGWQMVYGGGAGDRWYLRQGWPSVGGWVEMIHSGNIGSQSVSYASSAGNADTVDGYHASNFLGFNGNSYYQASTWIQFNTTNGLYWPSYNGAHLYANDGSYGSIKILGSRNGWYGIEFGNLANLMMNTNESGVHNNSYGWQWRWYQGTMYVRRSTYGGGTEYTVLDSGNYTSYAIARAGDTVDGVIYFRTNLGGYCGSLSNARMQAYSDSNNSAFISFHKSGQYAVNMGLDADNVLRIGGWSASSNRWQLDMSGNMTVAGDVTAYSDARVKENVITVEDALDKVLSLRGVYYNRTDSEDKRRKVGVIAQEIMEVIPEVVGQDNDGMYNVSYGNIVGVLIEAIKEQQKQIDELKEMLK